MYANINHFVIAFIIFIFIYILISYRRGVKNAIKEHYNNEINIEIPTAINKPNYQSDTPIITDIPLSNNVKEYIENEQPIALTPIDPNSYDVIPKSMQKTSNKVEYLQTENKQYINDSENIGLYKGVNSYDIPLTIVIDKPFNLSAKKLEKVLFDDIKIVGNVTIDGNLKVNDKNITNKI